jgi:hypothetical protein
MTLTTSLAGGAAVFGRFTAAALAVGSFATDLAADFAARAGAFFLTGALDLAAARFAATGLRALAEEPDRREVLARFSVMLTSWVDNTRIVQ